jgi:hypothetical protein
MTSWLHQRLIEVSFSLSLKTNGHLKPTFCVALYSSHHFTSMATAATAGMCGQTWWVGGADSIILEPKQMGRTAIFLPVNLSVLCIACDVRDKRLKRDSFSSLSEPRVWGKMSKSAHAFCLKMWVPILFFVTWNRQKVCLLVLFCLRPDANK